MVNTSGDKTNAYLLQGIAGVAGTASAGNVSVAATRFHPSTGSGGLAIPANNQDTGTQSYLQGIHPLGVLYAPQLGGGVNCNNATATIWLEPWNPTASGSYSFQIQVVASG